MAPRDQDPESEKRKDIAFDRILAEALPRDAHKDCPNAETLAAFYDHALTPGERGHVRSHLATCSRCQQAFAAMAASDPNPLAAKEIEHLGELFAAAAAPSAAAPPRKVLNWPRYLDPRTLAPLAAAAALVVALWATLKSPNSSQGLYQIQFATALQSSEPTVAENQATPSPLVENAAPPANRALQMTPRESIDQSRPAPPTATAGVAAPEQSHSAPGEAREQSAAATPPSSPPPPESASDSGAAPVVTGEFQAGAGSTGGVGGATAGGAPAANSPSATPAAQPAPQQAERKSEAVAADSTSAGFGEISPRVVSARAKTGSFGIVAAAQNNSLVVWQFGRAGRIERSADGGATWIAQSSPVQSDLLAGSAPSEIVCWLAGRNGTILRTTDGAHWEIVPTPPQAEQNRQSPDWSSIEARDAVSATVGAKDGRRYSTTDAGKTWQAQ